MKQRTIFTFPQNVFILSVVSFLNDIGGQTIKYAIPLFLSNVLGTPTSIIGLVEGVGEATPQLLQPVSGWLSDRWQKRKSLVLVGQLMRSFIVILVGATSWPLVLAGRFLDRSGKGIQVAPRDALLSSSASVAEQGKAFGLSRMLDNAGAVVGLSLAAGITAATNASAMHITQELFQHIVLLSVIPMGIAVVLIWRFVHDVPADTSPATISGPHRLPFAFWRFLLISFVFTIGNSSDAFLILRAQQTGMSIGDVFLLLAAFSLVASLVSLPAGMVSDRIGRKRTILSGWILYAIVYLGFAQVMSSMGTLGLFLLYGVYYGLTEGAAKAYVADIVPQKQKGAAFGIYNMTVGLTLLPASFLAGYLWQTFSPAVAFTFGATTAILASGLLLFSTAQSAPKEATH